MHERKGKLIVIEGIDGSGKKTQAQMLKDRIETQNAQCELISFPRYRQPAAYFEETYLRPDSPYGSPSDVGPYRASMFYALDRYDASFQLWRWLAAGAVIVADRYLISNIAHQGGKIADEKERAKYAEWLYDTEYNFFGIPKPDLNIILTLPVSLAEKRVAGKKMRLYLGTKQGAKDAHEKDEHHLANAQNAYLWIAKKHPDEFRIVKCVEGEHELTEQEISDKIWAVVRDVAATSFGAA